MSYEELLEKAQKALATALDNGWAMDAWTLTFAIQTLEELRKTEEKITYEEVRCDENQTDGSKSSTGQD